MRLVAIMDALVIMVVVHMIATITLNTKEKPSKSKKQAPETIEKTIEIYTFFWEHINRPRPDCRGLRRDRRGNIIVVALRGQPFGLQN